MVDPPGQAFTNGVSGLAVGDQSVAPPRQVFRVVWTDAIFGTGLIVLQESALRITRSAILGTEVIPVGVEALILAQGSASAEDEHQQA